MKIEKQLGKRIKYLRSVKKMTIEELSFECGISKNYLCDLENGKRNPSINILDKISKVFDMSISELLDGIGSF